MICSGVRGHRVIRVGDRGYYEDNFEIAFIDFSSYPPYFDEEQKKFISNEREILWNERPCKRCGHYPNKKGHDYCIQDLSGIIFACCGHGVDESYIKFENGLVIRGWTHIERGDLNE